ncbi:MAG: hypothetical protein JXX28_09740 [Deltaproteobacteria bacterium]|nr:hypothetical protein [Deltaproteobacteria bacterium]
MNEPDHIATPPSQRADRPPPRGLPEPILRQLLPWIGGIVMVMAPIATIQALFSGGPGRDVLGMPFVVVGVLVALGLWRRDAVRASWALMAGLWAATCVGMAFDGGLHSSWSIMLMALVVLAAMLDGRRGAAWSTAAALLVSVIFLLMEDTPLLPPLSGPQDPFRGMFRVVAAMAFTAVILHLGLHTLSSAVGRVQEAERAVLDQEEAIREQAQVFRVIDGTLPGPLLLTDEGRGRFRLVGGAWWALTGQEGLRVVEDPTALLEVVAQVHRAEVAAHLTNPARWPSPVELIGRSGAPLSLAVRCSEPDADGIRVTVLTDVTEQLARRREEARHAEGLQQAEELEALGRLSGGVAHDLRNMLSAIQAYTRFTEEELEQDHPARADLDEIQLAAARAETLTTALLAFAGRARESAGDYRVSELVGETLALLGRLLPPDVRAELVSTASEDLVHGCAQDVALLLFCVASDCARRGAGQLQVGVHPDEDAVRVDIDGAPVGDLAWVHSMRGRLPQGARLWVAEGGGVRLSLPRAEEAT